DNEGWTPLIWARCYRRAAVIKHLTARNRVDANLAASKLRIKLDARQPTTTTVQRRKVTVGPHIRFPEPGSRVVRPPTNDYIWPPKRQISSNRPVLELSDSSDLPRKRKRS